MPDLPQTDAADPAHGVAGWPFGGRLTERPAALPDGSPWPRVRVLTPARGDEPRLAETIASVARQDYPESRHDVVPASPETGLAAPLADGQVDAVLILPAGDLLAPGALTALALELVLTGAEAVAGLRVLFDRTVIALDAPELPAPSLPSEARVPSPERERGQIAPTEVPPAAPTGGILWSRAALAPHLDGDPATLAARVWRGLADAGARLARIGRPVLLQHAPGARVPADGLSVAALTGTGYAGGAGIAHRRLAEALRLSGHRVSDHALSAESPPAAAEWTDRFPRTEGAIRGRHDLVLVGNLHGATRSLDVLTRLGAPAFVVLHDLFPLTGRCAHPAGCPRATGCDESCPSPDAYPQLAPRRIGPARAGKRAVLGGPDGPVLLANSAWTLDQARALAPPGTPVAPVSLGFPTGVFRPRDRTGVRAELGLPPDDVLILVSSVIVDGPDKGFDDLAAALRSVARPGVGFVVVGRLDDPGRLGLPNLFAPGAIAEEARLAAWYGACDLHVTASRLETLGQTPIEAGLCGTPTLAYACAGLTTSVIDGVSGRLVPDAPGALAAALADLVADRAARERLGAFARIVLESRFSPASAALSLDAVLRAQGLLPPGAPRFLPDLLGHFPFAAHVHPGAVGTVGPPSGRIVRRLRRAKQALIGRNLPLAVRHGLYLGALVRQAARRAWGR